MNHKLQLDAENVVQLYQSGMSLGQLAQLNGCSMKGVRNCLTRAGVAIRPKPSPDIVEVVNLYRSGMSENQVAQQMGVSRGCIRNRLIKAGITPRTQSEAEALKWDHMTAEQRLLQTASAHKATRGRVQSEQERIHRAETRYRKQSHISANEQRMADWLRALGLDVEQQFPIYAYNVDLAIQAGPIAVEIHGGGWHSTDIHAGLMERKRKELFGRGWALVEVWIDNRFNVWGAVADQLITLIDELCELPSLGGEHWVILGNRKTPATLRADSDDLAAVFRPRSSENGAGLDASAA
jgi:very-short-patch-repair endonuclease/lambda repressor-like predicted transcriptional regulator